MTLNKPNSIGTVLPALVKVGLVIICLLVILPASAQNTKGDKPAGRESRFKLPFRKDGQKRKGPSGKRVKSKGKSYSNSGRAGFFSRKGGSVSARNRNVFSQRPVRSSSKSRERAGRPTRPVYSSRPSERSRFRKGDISGHRIRAKSSPGRTHNVYPQRGYMVHNPSSKPRNASKPVSNRTALARVGRLQSPASPRPGRKQKVIPRSASASFIARRTNNNWRRFPQARKKGEVATTRDLAGRRLRTKNYETKRPAIIQSGNAAFGRGYSSDRPYRGRAAGSYRTASRRGRAWKGDIAGGQIRGRNYSSKGNRTERAGNPSLPLMGGRPRTGDRRYRGAIPGNGARSASQPGEKRTGRSPLAPRVPGIGANGIGYQGRIKSGRPLKGGGSVSGRGWNNRGTAIAVRPPSMQGMRAGGYPGKLKRFQVQPGFRNQGEEFTGFTKSRKPPKGGGSVSGKLWNNRQQPIVGKTVGVGALRVGSYQGNIKGGKPLKGGGSVSGKLWNNKETPIPVKTPPPGAEQAGGFPGRIKRYSVQPGFSDQGEEFTGFIKKPWYRRAYSRSSHAHEKAVKQQSPSQTTYQVGNLQIAVKTRKYKENPNAAEGSLPKLAPTKSTMETNALQIKMKRPAYVKNPNSAEAALKKLKPSGTTYQVGELQIKMKQRAIGRKPHAVEGSLPGIKPSSETVKASQYARGVKKDWNYIRNSSSSRDALKVREPGKAFARATDFQGNIKMRKFGLFEKSELHPDAKFVKINKNNVAEERGLLTNIKLWWARTFKKNDNLPDHLKDKGRKPRYDKGELGMWNE